MAFDFQISFATSALKAQMHTESELYNIIRYHSEDLKVFPEMNAQAFLMAIADLESSFGEYGVPRFELSYSRSSIAYKKSKLLQDGYREFGDLCACSYGPFQILWIVARELGYRDHPLNLWSGVISVPYVVEYINKFFNYGPKNEMDLAAMYNAGPGVLKNRKNWPTNYVDKFIKRYKIRRGK